MTQEIERKFRISGDYRPYVIKSYRIAQGYISSDPERTVRVRIKGDKGFLTIKGIGNATGVSRYEWERGIPLVEANELLKLAEPGMIDKTRHIVPARQKSSSFLMCTLNSLLDVILFRRRFFEIDEFHGDNEGLVLAEIELRAENEQFYLPGWLGKEVTGDSRFYNSYLAKKPYKSWTKAPQSMCAPEKISD
ncbi:MAG: CYTH domain-containing protein [Hafnia sp.]